MTTEFTKESTIRESVLGNVSVILALSVLVVAAINLFAQANYLLGFIELLIASTFFHIYFSVQKNRNLSWQPTSAGLLITLGLLYGFQTSIPHTAMIMWAFVLPPLYQLLFSRVIGTLATFAMLAATNYLYFPQILSQETFPYSFTNFSLAYALVWLIAYNHETVRINVQKRLEQLAQSDALTGALNRLALQQDTATKLHCCGVSHLLHFDLDWFKSVNDNYGHNAGDDVLKTIVKEVQNVLHDSKIYRIGGEEFCVIFCADDLAHALEMSEQVRQSIESLSIPHQKGNIRTTISGGLVELPMSCTPEHLDKALQKTDKALYNAKNSGRNTILTA